jgi:hypothetical protein
MRILIAEDEAGDDGGEEEDAPHDYQSHRGMVFRMLVRIPCCGPRLKPSG